MVILLHTRLHLIVTPGVCCVEASRAYPGKVVIYIKLRLLSHHKGVFLHDRKQTSTGYFCQGGQGTKQSP
jgi:hypothetical protein